jgi:hypothetical protein
MKNNTPFKSIPDLLNAVPSHITVRQPHKWYHTLGIGRKKKDHALYPMSLTAWQLWTELQKPENVNNFDLTKKLLAQICPTLSDEEMGFATPLESGWWVAAAAGNIVPILEALGKDVASVMEKPRRISKN